MNYDKKAAIGNKGKLPVKIAFIASRFPSYDEAFLLRELHALSNRLEMMIFSLRHADRKQVIHDQAQELLAHTIYIPYIFSIELFLANLIMLLSRPTAYIKALFSLIAQNVRSPQFLAKSLVFFPKAVVFARWAEKNKVTHVHALWATYPASVAQAVKALSGIRFSFMGHAHDIYLDTTGLEQKIMQAEFISTCTSQNKDHLLTVAPQADPEKVRVIHHGLDLDLFRSVPEKGNHVYQILSVGTLHYYKGFNYFLDALALLKKRGIALHGTIIGGGPLEQDLARQIRDLGMEKEVTMTGPLKQSQVIPYYRQSDVSVLMAQSEWHWGIPNVLIESLAARTAVVTTRFGSVEELVHDGKTGFIVEAKNAVALADILERYYRDPDLRRRHAEAGCRLVMDEFDLARNIEEYCQRFQA
jgi:glycosyltransferase involved in cell wall biosynthesis